MPSRRPSILAALLLALLLPACSGSSEGGQGTDSPGGSPSSSAGTGSHSEDVISASPPPKPSGDGLRPQPEDSFDDQPDAYDGDDCHNEEGTEVLGCEYGAEDGDATVAVVGDSKALQWISAIDEIGEDRDWRVVTMTKSTCTWADAYVSSDQRPDTECWQWGQNAKDRVLDLDPDLVVTSFGHNMASPDDSSTDFSTEGLVDGLVSIWQELGDADVPVATLSDSPQAGELGDVPDCVATHRDDPDACIIEESEGIGTPPMRQAVKHVPSATLVDLTDVICPDDTCRPVFGDILVQRDGSHLTDTFVREVTPALDGPLAELVGTSR